LGIKVGKTRPRSLKNRLVALDPIKNHRRKSSLVLG